MTPTPEQLAALGLGLPPDPETVAASALPNPMPPILPSAPVNYPSSILGNKIPQGAQIPQTHQQGKDEFQEYMPQITASPGTTDYFRERQEQLDYKSQHPWGAPISPHPGVLGSILHGLSVAGNIAGDVVDPGAMSLIPGTQLHTNAIARGNEQGIQQGEKAENETAETAARTTAAGAEQENADTNQEKVEDAENAPPSAGTTPEELTIHDLMAGNNGAPQINPATKKPYSYLEAYMSVQQAKQDAKPAKTNSARVNYDQGIPVSVTDKDGNVFDVNDPKLPPELKPLVQAASRAHGQHVSEESNKQAAAFAQQEKMHDDKQNDLTAATRSMIEAAPGVLSLSARVRQLVDEQEKSLGPAAGRWNEFMSGKVGAPNAEFTKLRTDVGLLTTKLMRMHVGARGGEVMMQHFKDLIDSGKQSPENLRAALDEIDSYAKETASEKPGSSATPVNATPKATHVYDPKTGTVKPISQNAQ